LQSIAFSDFVFDTYADSQPNADSIAVSDPKPICNTKPYDNSNIKCFPKSDSIANAEPDKDAVGIQQCDAIFESNVVV
jgi:hypothetical protein